MTGKKTIIGLLIIAIMQLVQIFGVEYPEGAIEKIAEIVRLFGALLAAYGIGDKVQRLLRDRNVK